MKLQNVNKTDNHDTSMNEITEGIEDLKSRLNLLGFNLVKMNAKEVKEIIDEIDLIRIGINDINHYLNGVVNDTDRRADEFENRLNGFDKKNNITIWLIVVLLLTVISELIIFFII